MRPRWGPAPGGIPVLYARGGYEHLWQLGPAEVAEFVGFLEVAPSVGTHFAAGCGHAVEDHLRGAEAGAQAARVRDRAARACNRLTISCPSMPPRKDSPQPGKRELRRSLVEAEILEVAARTFAERGFGATSLDAIASELGLHRVSLYHYFDSKNAVLVRLVTDMLESSESAVEEIRALRGAGPGDRLRGAVGALLRPILEAPHRFRLFLTAGVEQSPELKDRAAAVRRVVVGEVTDIIRAGQASGEFRTTDVELAVFAILGMCNWVAWWPRTVRDKRPALADQLGRLAVAALAGGGSRTPDGPSELIASLQTDLERLAAMLGEDRR